MHDEAALASMAVGTMVEFCPCLKARFPFVHKYLLNASLPIVPFEVLSTRYLGN